VKILLTNISLDAERGAGTAERTRQLATHMTRLGHAVSVVAMDDGNLGDELRALSIPVYVTGAFRLKFQVPYPRPLMLWRLVREAEVIHVLGYWNLLSVATARIARSLRRPYALSAAGEFAALDNLVRPVPRLFHASVGRWLIAHASSIVAITDLEREYIISRMGIAPAKVIVAPNGVNEPLITGKTNPALPEGRFILFLGRLAPIKGPDLLLEAFAAERARFPDVKLVLAGPDFGMKNELEARIRELGVEGSVVFAGFLREDERQTAYDRAELVAVPSRAEAMSLVALEAGIMGTPVLLTDQCGFNAVESFGGGKVVPPDVEGLRRGLTELLSEKTDLAAMGQRLKSFVIENYAWPQLVTRLIDHLASLRRPPQ